MLFFAWQSLVYLCLQASGRQLLLFVVIAVVAADVGAYFAGRRFGKTKLAPGVSPGKSWEGVLGGLLAVLLASLLFDYWQPGLIGSTFALLGVAIAVAMASVLGDLFESLVKRTRGVKDSGSILPGHGGVLDRIDGLLAALPVFVFSLQVIGH